MPTTAIVCGILLIALGVIGYVFSIVNDNQSLTALIPAAFGLILALLGAFSRLKENLRKHLMHVAALVGLLGFILSAGRLASQLGKIQVSLAVLSLSGMALICLVFVILCIKSFVDARRSEK